MFTMDDNAPIQVVLCGHCHRHTKNSKACWCTSESLAVIFIWFNPCTGSYENNYVMHYRTKTDSNIIVVINGRQLKRLAELKKWHYMYTLLPCMHMRSRSKAIGLSVRRLSSVDPKIAITRDLGTWATCNIQQINWTWRKTDFNMLQIKGYYPRAS
jgi:hypothetical protein